MDLISEKNKASELLKTFCLMFKKQTEKDVKMISNDNEMEFVPNHLKKYYTEHNIMHQTSLDGTLQQNERVERKQTYFEYGRRFDVSS